MTVKILIPTPLRQFVEGRDEVEIEKSGTIGEVLGSFTDHYNGIKNHLYNPEGKLRKFVNIYVNDEDIRYQNGENTPVKAFDIVSIVPSIAGGWA